MDCSVAGLALGSIAAYGLAVSLRSLGEVQRGDVVSVHGTCPSCGADLYTFVSATDEQGVQRYSRDEARISTPHECHVCAAPLVIHAYLVRRSVVGGIENNSGRDGGAGAISSNNDKSVEQGCGGDRPSSSSQDSRPWTIYGRIYSIPERQRSALGAKD